MPNKTYQIKPATRTNLIRIVKMLSNDTLGQTREAHSEQLYEGYVKAFDEIDKDPNNQLLVMEIDDQVMGVLQLTFIPNLTYQGGKRAQIEGVRIDEKYTGKGFGSKLIKAAIDLAKNEACIMVQLTTNKQRTDAKRFYEKLGFETTHEGMKLFL